MKKEKNKIAKVEYGDESLAHIFDNNGYAKRVKLTKYDALHPNKIKIMCDESYAQELYDIYAAHIGDAPISQKDVVSGDTLKVRAISYCATSKTVTCECVTNGMLISIPHSEFTYDVEEIDKSFEFDIVITRAERGVFIGTCKNPQRYRFEIEKAYAEETWFNVKLTSLVRGGYRALYKGTVECFVPGSHAAANVLKDFESMIGKTIPVMVDNYDRSSRTYIVSYKKYVKHSMTQRVRDLEFGRKYAGTLTNNPTDYGLFVEFDNYYTGLVNKAEFADYESIRKEYRAGDKIDVYVKNVIEKNGAYRIVLTLKQDDIDSDKLAYYALKTGYVGMQMPYELSADGKKLRVTLDTGEHISVMLAEQVTEEMRAKYDRVIVLDVDVISREVNFQFGASQACTAAR